jgi:hypothetical protein
MGQSVLPKKVNGAKRPWEKRPWEKTSLGTKRHGTFYDIF